MAGHILVQHAVHERLPALARGLEIGQHPGAVAHQGLQGFAQFAAVGDEVACDIAKPFKL